MFGKVVGCHEHNISRKSDSDKTAMDRSCRMSPMGAGRYDDRRLKSLFGLFPREAEPCG